MKNILLVTKSFYPENSPRSHRATELVKMFSRMGHAVTVICPRLEADHNLFEKKHGVVIKDIGPISWQPIVLRGSGLLYWLRRILKRFANLLVVYPDIELLWRVRKALRNEDSYDLLISVAVPHPIHWGVAWARKTTQPIATIWAADCGDPFMGQENDTFKYPFYFKYVERWFCRKADYLTVPTAGAVAGYYPEFRHKIRVIPQGFDFDEKFPAVKTIRQGKGIAFAYAGMFIPGRRDPRELLAYLISTAADFEFHVFTPTVGLVLPFVKSDPKTRIILHEITPRPELLAMLSQMDFVVNFENIGSKQTPSKLIDYAIVQKPILSITTGGLDKGTVDQFLQGNYVGQLLLEDVQQYRIESVTQKFLTLAN